MAPEKPCPYCGAHVEPTDKVCTACYKALTGPAASSQRLAPANRVIVADIDMPFGSMVRFMVKWAFAAIPAVIILAVVWMVLMYVFAGLFMGIVGG